MEDVLSGRHTRTTARQGLRSPCNRAIRNGRKIAAIHAITVKNMAPRMEPAACTSRTPEKTTFAFETPAIAH